MASKSYVGIAPLTMVRTQAGGYSYVYANEQVPEDIDSNDLKRLVDEGFLGEAKAVEAEAAGEAKPANVKNILKDVGDDQEKAKAALEAERARGDDARKTLVEALEAIVAPPAD